MMMTILEINHRSDLGPAAYLLAHDPETTFLGCLDPDPDKQGPSIFPEGSVIIDPWRKCPPIPGCDCYSLWKH